MAASLFLPFPQDVDLSSVDGVVAVGGDGTFNEIANALIRRVNAENKVDVDDPESRLRGLDTRIGIIPCGSTDCMAFSTMGKTVAAFVNVLLRRDCGSFSCTKCVNFGGKMRK